MAILYRNNTQLPTQQDYEEAYARSAATDMARANAIRDEIDSWGAGAPAPVGNQITIGDILSTIGGGAKAAGRDLLGLIGAGAGAVGRGAGYAGELAGRGVAAGAGLAGRGLATLGGGVVDAGQGAIAAGRGLVGGLGGVARGAGGVMQGVGNLGLAGTQALGYGAKALGQGAIAAGQGVAGGIGSAARGAVNLAGQGARAIGNAGIGAVSTVGDIISGAGGNALPGGSRSEDYRNLSNGVNLSPQSFGLQYNRPEVTQPQARVFDIPAEATPEPRMTTDQMSFGDAFRTYRDMMGPGAVFMWNGKQYTTDMAEDVKPKPSANAAATTGAAQTKGPESAPESQTSSKPSSTSTIGSLWTGAKAHDFQREIISSGRDNDVSVEQMYDEDLRSTPPEGYRPQRGVPKRHGIREDGPREYYDYMFNRFFGPGGMVEGMDKAIKSYDNKYLYYNNGERVGWEELMSIERGNGRRRARGTVKLPFLMADLRDNMPQQSSGDRKVVSRTSRIAGPTHTSSY